MDEVRAMVNQWLAKRDAKEAEKSEAIRLEREEHVRRDCEQNGHGQSDRYWRD